MMLLSSIPKKVKPPRNFKSAMGVKHVRSVTQPGFACKNHKLKGAPRKGLRYESQVVQKIEDQLEDAWVGISGPWFLYINRYNKECYAQADWMGICPVEGRICLVEVKLTRVPKAWWQLNRLYKPLVSQLFPGWDISLLEVASQMAHFQLPEPVGLVDKVSSAPVNKTSFMLVPYEPSR